MNIVGLMLAQGGGFGSSSTISRKISWNICRVTVTAAIWKGDAAAVLMTLALIRATAAVDCDRGTVGIENPDFVPAPGSTATSARNPAALTPGTGRLAADNPDHRVQVRKIAIRITMTAITATAVFVIVTNV